MDIKIYNNYCNINKLITFNFGGNMKYSILLIFVAFIHSTIINIPDDFSTIQEGINNSVNGDTVLVQPGTYTENINFNGKNISLFGEDRESTIIDGGQNGSVVTFENSESNQAVLKNITISNGYSEEGGGGIKCLTNSSPILERLIISNNYTTESGGGIFCSTANPIIINSEIINNTSDWNAGGIYIVNGSGVQLIELIISGNHAQNDGGGILSLSHSNLLISNTVISNNTAVSGGGGGAQFGDSSPLIINTTISNNVTGDGGALLVYQDSSPVLINSILWSNYPNEISFRSNHSPSEITISYCDIQGGEDGITTYNNGIVFWENGNFDADPLFSAPDNEGYSLLLGSPAIDAGSPDLDDDGITWENDPDDQDPDGTRMDLGAYYFHPFEGCTDPFATNYNPDATIDDGSCIYEGCTYFQAINFNPGASIDDGSCEFQFADVNFDTVVDVLDIVIIISMIMEQ